MADESKTPIADQIRKLEFRLNDLKKDTKQIETISKTIHESPEYQKQDFRVNDPLTNCLLVLNATQYLAVLAAAKMNMAEELSLIETKLTTVYAALNDCLGDEDEKA